MSGAPMQTPLLLTPWWNRNDATIQERFETFHAAHPDIYRKLVELARIIQAKGMHHLGIALLWERLRWFTIFERDSSEDFKLCNSYRSRYARLIMETEPDLRDFFTTRRLRSL